MVTAITTDTTPALSWTFSYTGGYLTSMVNPEGNAATFAYDGSNRLTAMTTPRGTIPYTSEYDSVQVHGTGGSMFIPVVVKQTDANDNITFIYTYDPDTGYLASMTDSLGLGSAGFSYDAAGRITQITRKNDVKSTFVWDNEGSGKRTSIQDGDFTDVNYTFDAIGRITSVTGDLPVDVVDTLTENRQTLPYNAMSQVAGADYGYGPSRTNDQGPFPDLYMERAFAPHGHQRCSKPL